MTAVDTLITDLRANKISAQAQPISVAIDDFIAAIQLLQAGSISGPAGGDLSGTFPNPSVVKLQGVAISAVAPTPGQVLQLVAGVWTPTTLVTGPAIVQFGQRTGTDGVVVMPGGPVQGNLLVAIVQAVAVSPGPGAGWTAVQGSNINGANDDLLIAWKVAGVAESTNQTPTTDAGTGTITIYEVSGATTGIFNLIQMTGVAAFTQAISAQLGKLIIGVASCHNAAAAVLSLTGSTADGAISSGGGRAQQAFHATAPVQGAQTLGVTFTAVQTGSLALCEIG